MSEYDPCFQSGQSGKCGWECEVYLDGDCSIEDEVTGYRREHDEIMKGGAEWTLRLINVVDKILSSSTTTIEEKAALKNVRINGTNCGYVVSDEYDLIKKLLYFRVEDYQFRQDNKLP